MSSPVVAGIATLLASTIPEHQRWDVLNPASLKQILMDGAQLLPGVNIFEQVNTLQFLLISVRDTVGLTCYDRGKRFPVTKPMYPSLPNL